MSELEIIVLAVTLLVVGVGFRVWFLWWINRKADKAQAWLHDWYHDEGMLHECSHCPDPNTLEGEDVRIIEIVGGPHDGNEVRVDAAVDPHNLYVGGMAYLGVPVHRRKDGGWFIEWADVESAGGQS